jgi:glycosyltransferase involved in cell wall biosynthesis
MPEPKVAVLIPVYNAERFVRDTLLSVLGQRGCDFRVIVVDDGSTDRSVETIEDLCRDPRVTLIRQRNMGKPATINRIAREIDAEVLIVNDADDLSHPDRVARVSAVFAHEPDLAAVYSGYRLLLGSKLLAPVRCSRSREECRTDIELFRMPGHDATASYRLDALREFPLAEDLPIGEGLDLALRMGEHCPMRVIADCLLTHRVHASSITRSDPSRLHRYEQETLRRACVRRGIAFEKTPLHRSECPRENVRGSAFAPDLGDFFNASMMSSRECGRWREAAVTLLQGISLRPLSVRSYRALAYLLLPSGALVNRWSRRDADLRRAIDLARS